MCYTVCGGRQTTSTLSSHRLSLKKVSPTFFHCVCQANGCELPGILLSSAPSPREGALGITQALAMLCTRLLRGLWGFSLRSSDFHSYCLLSPLMLWDNDFVHCKENASLPRHLLISLIKQLNGYELGRRHRWGSQTQRMLGRRKAESPIKGEKSRVGK